MIEIPNIVADGCTLLSACGTLICSDDDIANWLDQQSSGWEYFSLEDPQAFDLYDKTRHIRLGVGKNGPHFHIDLGTHTYFSKQIKKHAGTRDSFNERVSRLMGQRITVTVKARFGAYLSSFKMARALAGSKQAADSRSARITQATFSLVHPLIKSVSWKLLEGEDPAPSETDELVEVDVECLPQETFITNDYLVHLFDSVRRFYKELISSRVS